MTTERFYWGLGVFFRGVFRIRRAVQKVLGGLVSLERFFKELCMGTIQGVSGLWVSVCTVSSLSL